MPELTMGYQECLAYFESDQRRLTALNAIRIRKGGDAYTLEEAASIMSCFGGCDREAFKGIDRAIKAELSKCEGRA